MNLARLIAAAHRRAPADARGSIVFTDSNGLTATGQASGTPPSGRASEAEGFASATVIRESHRRLSVVPDGLAFAPRTGMIATWEGREWNVLGVSPLLPGGDGAVLLYRVTLQA